MKGKAKFDGGAGGDGFRRQGEGVHKYQKAQGHHKGAQVLDLVTNLCNQVNQNDGPGKKENVFVVRGIRPFSCLRGAKHQPGGMDDESQCHGAIRNEEKQSPPERQVKKVLNGGDQIAK